MLVSQSGRAIKNTGDLPIAPINQIDITKRFSTLALPAFSPVTIEAAERLEAVNTEPEQRLGCRHKSSEEDQKPLPCASDRSVKNRK
ncbi:hypothetical protein STEG23_036374, partial [Scotinomys teguina]